MIPVVLNIISRGHNQSVWNKLKGKTVVVSGACEDLGRELCRELAKKNINLVLIGRDEGRLNRLKDEIESKNEIERVDIFVVGVFDDINFSFLDRFDDIGLLINQIVCVKGPTLYLEEEDLNIVHTTKITRRVLNKMIERKFGYILNIGSLCSKIPFPYLTSFAASHAYLRTWSNSLHYEMINYNIQVEYAEIGYLASKTIDPVFLVVPSLNTMAKCLLSSFGSARYLIPYPPHYIQACILSYLPDYFIGRCFEYFHRVLKLNKKHDDRKTRSRQALKAKAN